MDISYYLSWCQSGNTYYHNFPSSKPTYNNQMNLPNLLIFLISFNVVLTQDCLPFLRGLTQPVPGLEIGSVDLQNPGNAKRENYYNVSLSSAKNPYTVILGVSYIQKYFDASALDFQVRPNPQPTFFTINFFISATANWVFVHLNYIASSIDSVFVGEFQANSPELNAGDKKPTPKIITLSNLMGGKNKFTGNQNGAVARAYISGIKTAERFTELSIVQSKIDLKANIISVTINSTFQRSPIETLIITYIIYATVNTLVYTSVTNVNLTSSILKSSIENRNNANLFASITKASFKNVPKRLLVQLATLQQFTKNFEIEVINFQASNLATSVATITVISLPGSVTQVPDNCTTLSNCQTQGGTLINNPSSARPIICVLCRTNSEYSSINNNCTCLPDYYLDKNGQCIKLSASCKPPQVYINGSCFTEVEKILGGNCSPPEYFNKTNNQCMCRETSIFYQSKKGGWNCVAACENGFQFDLNKEICVCKTFLNQNKTCSSCTPPSEFFNVTTNKCECSAGYFIDSKQKCIKCGDNSQFSTTTKSCECNFGFFFDLNQICVKCHNNAQYFAATKTCKCNPGFVGNGYSCRAQTAALGSAPIITFGTGK